MSVKLASALPKDDKNGLAAIAVDLADRYYTGERTTAIVVLESVADTRKKGDRIPEVRVLRVEPVAGDLETDALDLLQQATEQRVGKKPDTLTFDEDAEFADIDEPSQLALEPGIEDAEVVDDEGEPAPTAPVSPLAPVGGDAA